MVVFSLLASLETLEAGRAKVSTVPRSETQVVVDVVEMLVASCVFDVIES